MSEHRTLLKYKNKKKINNNNRQIKVEDSENHAANIIYCSLAKWFKTQFQ